MKTFDFTPDNLGGLLQLFAIPPTSFVRIRHDYDDETDHLELTRLEDVIALPVHNNDSYSFNEDKSTSDAGDGWEILIEGVAPHLDKRSAQLMERLERGVWYVLAVDSNGIPHFCGQTDAWMTFDGRKQTGKSPTALNATAFTFRCLQDEPSLMVESDCAVL